MAAHSQLECVPVKGTLQGMCKEVEGTEEEKGGGVWGGGGLARQAGAD